jgi:hypothetical protein
MDALLGQHTRSTGLNELHVLVMPPPRGVKLSQHFRSILIAIKTHWDWRLNMLCESRDREWYKELVQTSGVIFTRPSILESPAPWEANAEETNAVDRHLWEAELSARLPSGQILLAAQATIGRAFVAPYRFTRRSAISRRVLNDNMEPIKIVRRLYRFAEEVLDACVPDVILTYEWGKPWRLAIWLAAKRRNIPCICLRHSKIVSDHHFWTSDRQMLNFSALKKAAIKRSSNAPVSANALEYIRTFRECPMMLNYMRAKWGHSGDGSWIAWHWRFAKALPSRIVSSFRHASLGERASLLGEVIGYNRRYFASRRQRQFFHRFDESELAAMKYLYFPFHKETDISLTVQAPFWQDQRNTVEVLTSCLPAGYRLLVRENRDNHGHRSTRYLRDLSRLPNVMLIDPLDSQYKYLSNADLIVTENGSSGWEGLLLKRRVLTLNRSFYDGAELARKVEIPAQLSGAIVEMLGEPATGNPEEHDRQLGWMIDAESESSFSTSADGMDIALDQLATVMRAALCRSAAPAS